jgi:glycerol-1-phosphate dehydrogenase [NAD(P)+]
MAIYVDLDFTKTASDDLIKAGIGDSLCYSTCNFDWLLSHLILKTPFDEEVFKILQPFQEELLNYQGNLRDEKFMQLLYEILIISGISMTICKGSYPASQGEHLIAHYLEMKYPKILEVHFHGLQIAVTTLSMIEIQEKFLKANELKLKNFDINLSYLINLFDKNEEVALNCRNELQQKNISNQKLIGINEDLKNTQKELLKVFISKEKILDIYKKFSLPQKPQDLEINQEIYEEALNNAFIIRNRLTSLDFIYQ